MLTTANMYSARSWSRPAGRAGTRRASIVCPRASVEDSQNDPKVIVETARERVKALREATKRASQIRIANLTKIFDVIKAAVTSEVEVQQQFRKDVSTFVKSEMTFLESYVKTAHDKKGEPETNRVVSSAQEEKKPLPSEDDIL